MASDLDSQVTEIIELLESFSSLGSRFVVKTDNVATSNSLIITEEREHKAFWRGSARSSSTSLGGPIK